MCFCSLCDCSQPLTFSGLVSLSQTAHPVRPSPSWQGTLSPPSLATLSLHQSTRVHSTQFSFPITDSPLSKASLILPALLHHSLLPSDGDLIPDVVSAHFFFFFPLSLRFNLLSQGGITSCLSLDLHTVNSKAHL